MSATTITPHPRLRPAAGRAPGRVTPGNLVRSEWTKLWTVRSTRWSLLAAFLLMLSGIAIAAIRVNSHPIPAHLSSIDMSVAGYHFAELAIAVLGVMVITGEYATGMIRSSLMAAPRRLPVLWAKLAVFAAVTLVTMLVASFIAFFAVQAVVSGHGLQHAITDQNALRTVIGAAVLMAGVGVLGTAVGALTRNTAAGISSVVALLWVLPVVISLLPSSISNSVNPYLPSNAIASLASNTRAAHTLGPWAGLAVLAGYAAVAVVVGGWLIVRRDA